MVGVVSPSSGLQTPRSYSRPLGARLKTLTLVSNSGVRKPHTVSVSRTGFKVSTSWWTCFGAAWPSPLWCASVWGARACPPSESGRVASGLWPHGRGFHLHAKGIAPLQTRRLPFFTRALPCPGCRMRLRRGGVVTQGSPGGLRVGRSRRPRLRYGGSRVRVRRSRPEQDLTIPPVPGARSATSHSG